MHARAALALLLLLSACAAPAGRRDADPGVEAALRARLDAMERAFEEGDPIALADVYDDDALLLNEGGTLRGGREDVVAYWSDFDAAVDPAPRDWILETWWTEAHGAVAHQRGRSTIHSSRGGEPRTARVEYVLVWRRDPDDGVWRIVVDAYWQPPGGE